MSQWVVDEQGGGLSLGQWLKKRLNRPLRAIKRDLEGNACRLNGELERFASRRVKVGDRVYFSPPRSFSEEPYRLSEHREWVAFYKPAGMQWEQVLGDLWAVHRIDRDTSGILLAATSLSAQQELIGRWCEVEKRYLAWVEGHPPQRQWRVENRLAVCGTFHGQKIWGAASFGKWARTDFEVLEQRSAAALVACAPTTGRTHQIRVHLAEEGLPIIGDGQYGRAAQLTAARHLLHAHRLRWGDWTIEAPLPADFLEVPW